MFLSRLYNEPRFAGSRAAPAGCQEYTTPGSYTFTWPDGVDRAVVFCRGAGGAGATATDGGGGGGGGATSERLVLKTDATATVNVGSGGATSGANGGDSELLQASTVVEYCNADGGKGASSRTGGAGGSAAASYGTIKYSGGSGGDSTASHDGGGGGGSSSGGSSAGEDGQDSDTQGVGGAGGGGDGGPGGDGGDEGENGTAGASGGGGGGGGDGGAHGAGGGGYVSVCWEDPLPAGYCVGGATGGKRRFWPRCNHNCASGYGYQCFYYGYGYHPPPPYFYDDGNGWPLPCCGGILLGPVLHASVTGDCDELFPDQVTTLYAVEAMSSHPSSTAEPSSCSLATGGTPPHQGYLGDFIFGPSWGTGGTGVTPNQIAVILAGSACWVGTARDGLITGCLSAGDLEPISCDPLFLVARLFGGAACPSGDFNTDVIITD